MKACIYSLGCRVNIYESEYVEVLLKSNGFEIVDFNSGNSYRIDENGNITIGKR